MGGKKKAGKGKSKKKAANGTEPDQIEKNFILQAEIESLAQKLVQQEQMADQTKAAENEKRRRMI